MQNKTEETNWIAELNLHPFTDDIIFNARHDWSDEATAAELGITKEEVTEAIAKIHSLPGARLIKRYNDKVAEFAPEGLQQTLLVSIIQTDIANLTTHKAARFWISEKVGGAGGDYAAGMSDAFAAIAATAG